MPTIASFYVFFFGILLRRLCHVLRQSKAMAAAEAAQETANWFTADIST